MNNKTRRIFLSDLHLSTTENYKKSKLKLNASHNSTYGTAWYNPEIHDDKLHLLTSHILNNHDSIKDVVLCGDIFNTWVCPIWEAPPTYENILEDNLTFTSCMREISNAGINLFYIKGNHDFDIPDNIIYKYLPKAYIIKYYRSGRIMAEHGHQYDLFNTPDFTTDPAYGRPIGYYISRLAASTESSGYSLIDLPSYVDDIIEAALTKQTLFGSILEALYERIATQDRTGSDTIIMPDGVSNITIEQLKALYTKVGNTYSSAELLQCLFDRRYMHGTADRLCKKLDLNVILFGHTHNALLDKDWFLTEDRIYANTGAWCKDKSHYVVVEKTEKEVIVTLNYIDNLPRIHTKSQEKITY
jgi:UDP-2,3-diacylglucosamine pyrophosphatase LpxH